MSPFMESEKLLISRGNPRTAAYSSDRPLPTTSGRAMPNELPQKPPPSIAQRFRAHLKQRDDEFRVSGHDAVPPPSAEDIVQLYELMLSELTFNSKPIITDLTVLADEHREHGKGIADLICARILEVPVDQKLPSLYLLDSIVKNVGHEYISYFSPCLPEVFCEAYRRVHPNLHNAMRHLFGTWSTVFPPSILRKIETQLSQLTTQESSGLTSSRASESPRPTHGIHVNPKYLRQLEHSAGDKQHIQDARGTSALKLHDKKLASGYEEYDYDHADVLEHGRGQPFNTMGSMGHDSFAIGTNKSSIKIRKSSLSSRIGHNRPLQSVGDELEAVRASPSQNVYDYEGSRIMDRNEDTNKWRRNQYPDDNLNGLESTSTYNFRNGHTLEGPRALIEAYGSDKGKGYLNDNSPQVEHFSINGLDNKVTPVTWQNTEEEEFDWEDMSPTLADRSRSNDVLKPTVPPSRFRTRLGFDRTNAMSIEPRMGSNWSSQVHLPTIDSSIVIEDEVPSTSDIWNMHNHLSETSQNLMNIKGTGRNFQMPWMGRGTASSGGEKMSPFVDKLLTNDASHRPPTIVSRLGSSGLDSSMESQSVVHSMGPMHPVNVPNSCPPSRPPIFPLPRHYKSQFESLNGSNSFINRANRSFLPEQQMNSLRNKDLSLTNKLPQVGNQHIGRIPLTHGNQMQAIPLKHQFLPSKEMQDNFSASAVPPTLPHLMAPSLSQGYSSQGHRPAISECLSSSAPIGQWNLPVHNSLSNPLHLQGGPMLPLPPRPHPTSVQRTSISQNAGSLVPGQQPGTAFSGLISSLMAQGLISLNNQASAQDSIGLEFNPDVLKVRHESAITALYADLPRQCMTCGLRFKSQEEHSNHMDWHVTRNRMSKSRKQKPSRKWFVSTSMWLSGAEALGTEAVPGFLPTEVIVEEKGDEELAVPADEDQKTCALCGEPFDDFYSDETEEWMYRGAVYMNAPDGQTAGMDISQLGPIVHAKCMTESNVASSENFDQDEQGEVSEEGNRRKRLRS